jgi:cell wall assembly regulator SMI1
MSGIVRELDELWRHFENWLAEHAPGDYASLQPGASQDDIKRLEDNLGFPLHTDVRTTLELHNGVSARTASTEPGAFLLGYSLLDVEGVLAAYRDLLAVLEEAREQGEEELAVGRMAHRQWVPLAQGMTGDLLFVDHRPHYWGEIGEMSFGDPEYRLLWPRMDLMLEALCSSVENRTPVTSIPRVPSLYEGRMIDWHVRTAHE